MHARVTWSCALQDPVQCLLHVIAVFDFRACNLRNMRSQTISSTIVLAPVYLAKLNVKSAFCRIPVRPEDWSLSIRWQDQYFYESALPFRLYYAPVQLYGTLSHPPVNGLCASSSHSHACCITGNTSTNVTSSVHALDLC